MEPSFSVFDSQLLYPMMNQNANITYYTSTTDIHSGQRNPTTEMCLPRTEAEHNEFQSHNNATLATSNYVDITNSKNSQFSDSQFQITNSQFFGLSSPLQEMIDLQNRLPSVPHFSPLLQAIITERNSNSKSSLNSNADRKHPNAAAESSFVSTKKPAILNGHPNAVLVDELSELPVLMQFNRDFRQPSLVEEIKKCANCGTTKDTTWRRSQLNPGERVCNACGQHELKYSKPRDKSRETGEVKKRKKRPRLQPYNVA